jgi:hypothetical protein
MFHSRRYGCPKMTFASCVNLKRQILLGSLGWSSLVQMLEAYTTIMGSRLIENAVCPSENRCDTITMIALVFAGARTAAR